MTVPAARVRRTAQTGCLESALATTSAPPPTEISTSMTPATSRRSNQDGTLKRRGVGEGVVTGENHSGADDVGHDMPHRVEPGEHPQSVLEL
jgi:hypothetical protein